jgi:hypothetical protein
MRKKYEYRIKIELKSLQILSRFVVSAPFASRDTNIDAMHAK